jgi:hypothetical protein
MKTSCLTQFGCGETIGSEQRLLLPVNKAHASHSHSDLRSEEEVQLLADHHNPLHTIGYVAALLCNSVNCTLNSGIISVLDFVFFSDSSSEIASTSHRIYTTLKRK